MARAIAKQPMGKPVVTGKATDRTRAKAISFALPSVGETCVECVMGAKSYVPCRRPALRIITHHNGEVYPMCLACADHNVRNRSARYVEAGETYTITKIQMTGPTPASAPAGLPTRNTAGAAVDVPQASTAHPSNALNADEMLDIEAAPEAGEGELSKITRLAERQVEIKKEITALEKQLAAKQAELKVNQETDLPEALDAAGTRQFTLSTGQEIEIKDVVAAGITKANQDPGFAFLERIGWGTLIQRVFQIKFDRKDIKLINKFKADLAKRKIPLKVEIKMSVNGRSLAKSIRENDALPADDDDRIDLSVPVPGMQLTAEKLLGVWRVRKAIVGTDDTGDTGGDDAAIG